MRTRQSGFTMIELIMVIVILGILAAMAMPKFVNLRTEASQAAVDGVAGASASAMAVNYASCAALNNTATAGKCVQITNCNQAGSLLQGGLPAGYVASGGVIDTDADTTTENGETATCTVTYTVGASSWTANFVGIAAANAN